MRTPCVLAGAVLLATAGFCSGQDYIIKQRAKELSNQNNVRQGVAPPTQPTQPPAPGVPQPAAPTLTPGLAKFRADLANLPVGAAVPAQQKQQLAQELVGSAQGAKPSVASASKFVDSVAAATDKPLPVASRARLAQELDAVLNPGKYPQAKLDGIFNDIQAIFQENGASRTKAVTVADSVRAMSTEIQGGGAK